MKSYFLFFIIACTASVASMNAANANAPYCAEEAVAHALDARVEFIGFEKDADIVNYGMLENKEIYKINNKSASYCITYYVMKETKECRLASAGQCSK